MEGVKEWLRSNGLGAYSPNFEEYGWDEVSLLLEITENELEACIKKAGHRARFRKALRLLRHELDTANSGVELSIPQDLVVLNYRQSILEDTREHVGEAATLLHDHSIPLTVQAGQNRTETSVTTASQHSPVCTTKVYDVTDAVSDSNKDMIDTTPYTDTCVDSTSENDASVSCELTCSMHDEYQVLDNVSVVNETNDLLLRENSECVGEAAMISVADQPMPFSFQTGQNRNDISMTTASKHRPVCTSKLCDATDDLSDPSKDIKDTSPNTCLHVVSTSEYDTGGPRELTCSVRGEEQGQVLENVYMLDEDQVLDNASVLDEDPVPDNASVLDEDQVPDNASVLDEDQVPDNASVLDGGNGFTTIANIPKIETLDVENLLHCSVTETNHPFAVLTNIAQQSPNLMCGAPVNLTIIKNSEHTTVAEAQAQMIGEPGSSSNPVQNLKEQMEMIANAFEEKDQLYVETKAFRELKSVAKETNWATILGKPGDGKSATAAHLMLLYRKRGFNPIFVSSPQDWKMLISSNSSEKQFVTIDDLFGTSYTDNRKVDEWLSMIEYMEKIVKERKGNLVVVCTSRRYVFTDVQSTFSKFACFGKVSIVDMTDEDNRLSGDEKLQIFKTFAEKYGVTVEDNSYRKIRQLDPPHGFPHCVEMFCTNIFLRQSGLSFFNNPTKCVQKEIHNIKDNDPFKFFVLLLMLLKKRPVSSTYFGKMVNSPSGDEIKLFKSTGLSIDTAYPGIMKAVDSLLNTYLKLETDSSYTFAHESLKENVACVYISVHPAHAAELLNFQQIVTLTNLDKTSTSSNGYSESPAVQLPTDILVEEVTKEILRGNIRSACKCDAWNGHAFVNEWIKFITCDCCNISGCLLKIIVKDIFCSKGNLLATLIQCNKHSAVMSMLKNAFLQQILKQFSVWSEILQGILDTTCARYWASFDIEVVRYVLKLSKETNIKKLSGSYALTGTLQGSRAECAKLLLRETRITPDSDHYEGGYFHHLVNSGIVSDDFNAICVALLEIGADINQKESRKGIPAVFQCIANTHMQVTDLERLSCLVEKGADIHKTIRSNENNIVAFVLENLPSEKCLHLLPKLIELGANLHCVNKNMSNALHVLFRKSPDSHYLDLVNYLLDIGVNAAQGDCHGTVPLMVALQSAPDIEYIQRLMKLSPRKHTDNAGQGYFHYLLQSKSNLERFRLYSNTLFETGEEINLKDKNGIVPVFTFCQKALENLRTCGETQDVLQCLQSASVNFQIIDKNGKNILHHLFSRAANPKTFVSFQASTTELTTVTWDVSPEEDTAITSIYNFLEKNYDISCFKKDKENVNPLMLAIQNCAEFSCIKDLLNREISLDYDKHCNGYFHYLSKSRASDVRFELIKTALLKNNIPYLSSTPTRLPHYEEELS